MRQQSTVTTRQLTSVTGLDGEIQLVSYRSGVLIDVQGSYRRVDGEVSTDHGCVRLTYIAACELRDRLAELTAPDVSDDVRQTQLWSETPIKMVSPKVYRRQAAA